MYVYIQIYVYIYFVNSTDLRSVKHILKLDDVILEFCPTRLLQTTWF